MYTLAVEIHSLRQLTRLQPEMIDELRQRLITAIEMQGGGFALASGSLLIFRFERAQPSDHQGVLEALRQTAAILRARSQELSGWNAYLDFLEMPTNELVEQIRDTLFRVYEGERIYIGATSEPLLGHFLPLSPVDATDKLFEVGDITDLHPGSTDRIRSFAASEARTEQILDVLDPNEVADGVVLIHSEDAAACRFNADRAVTELFGSQQAVQPIQCYPDFRSPLSSICCGPTDLDIHEARFWLSETEKGVWDERIDVLTAVRAGALGGCVPDSLDDDLLSIMELLYAAYLRRAVDSLVPPIVLCHDVHKWPSQSLDALARIAGRLLASEMNGGQTGLLVVVTSDSSVLSPGLATLVRRRVRLARNTTTDLRLAGGDTAGSGGTVPNWERVGRVTGGMAGSVHHYLLESRHWDTITDDLLQSVSPSDLAWRVIGSQDTDVQETLLALCHTYPILVGDVAVDALAQIGIDRVRVPTVVSLLRSHGLVSHAPSMAPEFPELMHRLETALGSGAAILFRRLADHVVRLLQDGKLDATENVLRFLKGHEKGAHLPWAYHRLVSSLLDRRRTDDAQRMLYEEVPAGAFGAETRASMQDALTSNRLRLAAIQGNMENADRVWAAAERAGQSDSDFIRADLALQRARIAFQKGPSHETLTHLKRAIMLYQEVGDNAGLARANLDFGLLLLAQENVVGAREYFLLASKAAAMSTNRFVQIRAMLLTLVCTFVHGNLSRVLEQSEELASEAAHAGMREIQLFTDLVNGRVLFELGRYDEAADRFASGRSRAHVYSMRVPGAVFERWVARSLIYDERARRGVEILGEIEPTRESLFFLAEGWLRRADHGRALEALTEALSLPGDRLAAVESISWKSGFAQLEDRSIGATRGIGVLEHQIMSLRGYILAESGRSAEGVQEMYRLTREQPVSDVDPFNRVYFYLYSLILPESGELNLEDGTTVLGKAVRYIQERTSRMDEYTHKTDFLRRNYWNARLMSHAQNHNLV